MHVINNGTYITTPEISTKQASVDVVTSVTNYSSQAETATLLQYILNEEGKLLLKVITKSNNSV